MAYGVKALAVMPDDLRLKLRIHTVEGNGTSYRLFSDLHVYPHTLSKYKVNKFNLNV